MNRKYKVSIRSFIITALVGVSMLSVVGNADATLTFDYTFGLTNPSISYDQTKGILVGTIPLTTITAIDTDNNSYKPFALSGGALYFETGKYDENTGYFAPGGKITVTGGISGLSVADSTRLLSGGFDSGAFLTQTPWPTKKGGGAKVDLEASFSTTDAQSLYNTFGIPLGSSGSSDFSLTFLASTGSITKNSSNTLVGGYLLDTPIFASSGGGTGGLVTTPIPAAVWFFGSGLVSLAGLRGRRKERLAII